MNIYEKIALVIVGSLITPMIIFSFHELSEPLLNHEESEEPSDFDKSIGQSLEIGPFNKIADRNFSGGLEKNCQMLQLVILATLHDIKENLGEQNTLFQSDDKPYNSDFEVNESTLKLFCNKNANITLLDKDGTRLFLEKEPFVRSIPEDGTEIDIGTTVQINATVLYKDTPPSKERTTYSRILIPDRFLDLATSTKP